VPGATCIATGGAGVAVHHKEVGVGAVEQQHPHVRESALASIEEGRGGATVNWSSKMFDGGMGRWGDVRHMGRRR